MPEIFRICDLRRNFQKNQLFEKIINMNGRESQRLNISTVELEKILTITIGVKIMIRINKRVSIRREFDLWTEKF